MAKATATMNGVTLHGDFVSRGADGKPIFANRQYGVDVSDMLARAQRAIPANGTQTGVTETNEQANI